MKTSYYLVTAAVLAAAAVTVSAQLPPPTNPPLPPVTLPPVSAAPDLPVPVLPPVAAQPVPVAPMPKPVTPAPLPVVPPPATIPAPSLPSVIVPPVVTPPPVVKPAPLPVVPPPVGIAPPAPLPVPTPVVEKSTAAAKYLVTADGKLVEGVVTRTDAGYVVRRGAIDTPHAKDKVAFVGQTKDDVYQHLLGGLDAKDVDKRLKLARWCAFNGMRVQGLTEAKAILALQPANADAKGMVRSLEESLQKFPEDGAPAAKPEAAPPLIPAAATEPAAADVTEDGAAAFASKAHPLLVNLCAECHAKPTHDGAFKMARSSAYDATASTVRQNLRVVATQLNKTEVSASPLLTKAVTPHGGRKDAPIASRQTPAYRNLEAWASVAVGADVLLMRPTPAPAVVPVATPAVPVVAPAAGFGAEAKADPKPTAPSPTNAGNPVDEFDPSVFNKAARPK